ncbi:MULTISPECIES: stalk domain-containing protein [unclassified Paenibacillus]|uniref:stalk domain-containing protein n=1 Tax=unclassified Paenibacillus TaxID=185978 RepID=UPI0030FAA09C
MHISKKAFVSTILASGLLFGAAGVYAADGISLVKAYLNSTIKFTVDGASWTPKDASGNKISPLVYNGSTYLPAKAVGEALNAEVLWNSGSNTVVISTTGGANAGIPYNDAAPSTPSASAPAANAPAASTPAASAPAASAPATQTASTPAGLITLPVNHDLNASGDKYKSVGLAFIQSYGKAVSSGSTADYDALVDKYVIDDLNDYDMGYKKRAKENFAKTVQAFVKVNEKDILTKYAAILKNATIDGVTLDKTYSDKGATYTTLAYEVDLPGFFISKFSVFMEFELDKKTNMYYLKAVNM